MTSSITIPGTTGLLIPKPRAAKSPVHRAALALVWLTVASSFLVFSEPAPVDLLTIALFVLLPVLGLTDAKPALIGGFALWLVIGAFGFLSAAVATDTAEATQHMAVSFYLSGACFAFALFVAKQPEAHTRLVLNGYLTASVLASILGIAGYLDLFPGAFDLLTRYGRATSTFKDPNVFGPFLIAGLLMALHLWLVRPLARGLLPLAAAALITVAILFTFSRGAWVATAIALGIYGYIHMITAERNLDRVKLAALVICGAAVLGLILAAALQSDGVASLLEERATLEQPYDQGVEGRFGGQEKAVQLILENPLGIGARDFTHYHHHEEAHNVYLSMMMNAGWPGGLLYLIICAATLGLGLQHAFKKTKTQPLFLIVFAALASQILQGVLIESDHWRHFYLLMGVVWGLMAADRRIVRTARIVRDVRPVLLNRMLLIPPSKRGVRITGRVPVRIAASAARRVSLTGPRGHRTRSSRILAAFR